MFSKYSPRTFLRQWYRSKKAPYLTKPAAVCWKNEHGWPVPCIDIVSLLVFGKSLQLSPRGISVVTSHRRTIRLLQVVVQCIFSGGGWGRPIGLARILNRAWACGAIKTNTSAHKRKTSQSLFFRVLFFFFFFPREKFDLKTYLLMTQLYKG